MQDKVQIYLNENLKGGFSSPMSGDLRWVPTLQTFRCITNCLIGGLALRHTMSVTLEIQHRTVPEANASPARASHTLKILPFLLFFRLQASPPPHSGCVCWENRDL